VLVFKFGGASVQDAEGLRRLLRLVRTYGGDSLWVVVSAMGKTTNLLEQVVQAVRDDRWPEAMELCGQIREAHLERIQPLRLEVDSRATSPDQKNLEQVLDTWMDRLLEELRSLRGSQLSYNCFYDQVVGYGEILSTALVSAYFDQNGWGHRWVDARDVLVTDATWRDARIQWEPTIQRLHEVHQEDYRNRQGVQCVLTQGFIGRDRVSGLNTTLGREGSDFTASVVAHALHARELWVWKDVDGVMDADPRLFPMARLLPSLSYLEAVEMTYYGATVIHPKTIQPLQNKGIPLRVRSFLHPEAPGTLIGGGENEDQRHSCVIVKKNQGLLELVSKDFSFISEEGLSMIYRALYEQGLKANLARHTAVSFSLVVDNDPYKLQPVQEALSPFFEIHSNYGLILNQSTSPGGL
jgi:aspartate kinase